MRQLNFLVLFVVCLALALFSIENTQPSVITIVPGFEISAPLSIELLFAVGSGALIAWMFSLWDQLQRQLEALRNKKTIRKKEQQIQNLEQELQELKAAIAPPETQKQLTAATETPAEETPD